MERKSLFDLSWKVAEDEYRADSAYSYSTLSKFHREGFSKLSTLFDPIDTPNLVFGSMVDSLALTSRGLEDYNMKFVSAEFPSLSDSLIQIAKFLFETYGEKYSSVLEIPDEQLSQAGIVCGYYIGAKYDTHRVKQIKENCDGYYQLLYLAGDRRIVSTEDAEASFQCVRVLKTSEATREYFAEESPFEKFYQLKFKGVFEGIPIRCMLDLVMIDHENKRIIPCDLKTTSSPEWEFYHSFVTWCYYIQAQMYWEILHQNLQADPFWKEYILEDFRFLVVSRTTLTPLVWNYPSTKATVDLFYGRKDQVKCKNWRNILKELNYYLEKRPPVPIGISTTVNDLNFWLNER